MGKIRVKTIGIEEEEDKEKKKIRERNEAKKAEAAKMLAEKETSSPVIASPPKADELRKALPADRQESSEEIAASSLTPRNDEDKPEIKVKKVKKSKFADPKKNKHSAGYLAIASTVDMNKTYSLSEALKLLSKVKRTKFDETVELHINTQEKGISGNVTLKHGTGKKARIEIADHNDDAKHVEELVEKIKGGQIDFDILIATPDTMPKLAVVARFLGPRGLMPNPKNGTINPKPKDAMKKFEGGQINFKTEAKAPIIHLAIGKLSFGDEKLADNIKGVLQAVQAKNIKNITLKSTMSPGIKIVA